VIEKFNFYDVYGYFIPGLVILLITYGPFALTAWRPSLDWGEFSLAVVAAIISYLVGYFLQSMATKAVPSEFGGRYPSTRLLDSSDKTLSTPMKAKISAKCIDCFGIDPKVHLDQNDEVDAVRKSAFRLARALTNINDSGTYAQQFQGLYSMMRGLAVAFALGFVYMLGWTAGYWHLCWIAATASLILIGSLIATLVLGILRVSQGVEGNRNTDILGIVAIAAMMSTLGCLFAQSQIFNLSVVLTYGATALLYAGVASRFYASYETFSWEFAKAVWTGFCLPEAGKR
jgi:hypothetical protein